MPFDPNDETHPITKHWLKQADRLIERGATRMALAEALSRASYNGTASSYEYALFCLLNYSAKTAECCISDELKKLKDVLEGR